MIKRILLILLLAIPTFGFAQIYNIEGRITDKDGNPIYFAVVNIKNTNNYVTSNEKGYFTLRIPSGTSTIAVSCLGYVTLEREISVKSNIKEFNIQLVEATLQIDEIVVTATQTQSKQGTSTYRIGEDAIKQVQAMSLSDIMQLIPGNKIAPPKFNSPTQINLRNASLQTESVNSFGTSVVIDGTPMNNDANMQATNPALGSSGGTNVANRGIDLREIQVSNIESVEVVAGVPSAKYGNLTSGTVLITRKAGYTPLYVNFNATPSSYQFGGSKGIKLSGKRGFLNVDADYTYSNSRPTEKAHYYQRLNGGLRWSTTLNSKLNWTNTVAVSYGVNRDGLKFEKDRITPSRSETSGNRLALSVNGRANFLGSLSYNFGVNYSKQYTSVQREESGPLPLVQPTESGTYFTGYTPLNFMQSTVMEGGPLSLYSRVDATQIKSIKGLDFNFMTGVEYSYNKNLGKGRVSSGGAVMSSNMPGARDAKFHEVPASTGLALYHETDITRKRENSVYLMRLGARYDHMNGSYNLFSPRLSFTARYYNKLRLRAAWGVSYKAPSMLSLYPGPVYFDLVNLSYFHNDPASRLAIITTTVYQPSNNHLKPSKGDTKEFGADWESGGFNIRVTAYQKKISGGISGRNQIMVLPKQEYRVVDQQPGKKPTVEEIPGAVIYLPRVYNQFANNEEIDSKGLEVSIEPPKIKSTNTSFMISGSIIKSSNYKTSPELKSSQINTNSEGNRYGLYESTKYSRILSNGNITVIQHLPALRMLITFVTELSIYEKRSAQDPSLYPYAYYDKTGNYYLIPQNERGDQKYKDLHLPENIYSYIDPPFYPNFHLQIRKETKQGHSFSFYANNCLWYNPVYTNDITNQKIRLNSKVSFGFGISIKL